MHLPPMREGRGPRPDIQDDANRPTITRWMVEPYGRVVKMEYIWGDEFWGWGVVEDGRHTGWCYSPSLDKILADPHMYRSVAVAIEMARRGLYAHVTRLNEQIAMADTALRRLMALQQQDAEDPQRAPW